MSDNLPALQTRADDSRIARQGPSGRLSAFGEWVASPLGRAVAQVLPDVIRMANRPKASESRPLFSQILPSSDGASGITLSEVEVDVDVPFIHRVTIRSASSWSVAPDIILAEQRNKRRGRWKLRALAAGALGVAGVVLARRIGMPLPARLNPAASLPFLSTPAPSIGSTVKNPGTAE